MKQTNPFVYGIIGVLIGGIIGGYVVSNTAVNTMMRLQIPNDGRGNMMVNNIDSHFIEQMIPHHEDAIIMAKLAQTKAQHTEVKQLARNIIDSQSKEIEQMEEWYTNWFDTEVPTGNQVMNQHGMMGNSSMHMGMMGDASDMTKLEQATDFDKVFIEEMIPHHQMAVMMATMLKNGTNRPEMKKLANDIIAAQTKEIDDMRQWYKNWGY